MKQRYEVRILKSDGTEYMPNTFAQWAETPTAAMDQAVQDFKAGSKGFVSAIVKAGVIEIRTDWKV